MLNFNGQILPADQPLLLPANRAFRYGDGLFETIRVFNGQVPFFEKHWRRLFGGMQVLKFETPPRYSIHFFRKEIFKLTDNQGNWRIRLTVFRGDGGLYLPDTNEPVFLIEAARLPSDIFELNKKGLTLAIFKNAPLACQPPSLIPHPSSLTPHPSSLKTSSALPFVLAAIFREENNCDDCLVTNTEGRIACGNSSNVFLWKEGTLVTPLLTEGCVAGTMRSTVLDLCKELKINALDAPISIKMLETAEEIFLTNAINGIRWVRQIKGLEREFSTQLSALFIEKLNLRIAKEK